MGNQRKLDRKSTTYYFKVFNNPEGELVGHAVDITTEGLMLVSDEHIRVGSHYHLMLHFPFSLNGYEDGGHKIEFYAKSVWSDKDRNTNLHDTGFQFEQITKANVKKIEALISGFTFKGPREQ